jgi:UDP-4-amino-4,6-dideoxy-N-acetyl-beta-L-altrosamine transaminase
VATNSATSALHIACLSLELKKNDFFWTVPNSFVASANCGLYCGAKVDFVDIDKKTYNISLKKLEEKLKIAKKKNKLPKILISVHFGGQSTDQHEIWKLSKKYNFSIIEDASHSLGAKHRGRKVGNCRWSDITVFSFHPVKPITTCEGGMALTNNKTLYDFLIKFRSHGITKDLSKLNTKNRSPWYYEQQLLGYNYRMNDLEAALGISQLKKIKNFIVKRNKIARRYDKLLKDLPIQLPFIEKYNYSSFHLYVIRFKSNLIKKFSYQKIFNKLRKKGIGINLHYLPIHLHQNYRSLGFKNGDFINAEKYSQEAVSLPIYNDLSFKQQDKVIKIIKDTLINYK